MRVLFFTWAGALHIITNTGTLWNFHALTLLIPASILIHPVGGGRRVVILPFSCKFDEHVTDQTPPPGPRYVSRWCFPCCCFSNWEIDQASFRTNQSCRWRCPFPNGADDECKTTSPRRLFRSFFFFRCRLRPLFYMQKCDRLDVASWHKEPACHCPAIRTLLSKLSQLCGNLSVEKVQILRWRR